MSRVKASVSAPATASWGGTVTVTAHPPTPVPSNGSWWLRFEARQGDQIVWGQYVKGTSGTGYVGPTSAADESQPADGSVVLGYWNRQGVFKAVAGASFDITP